MTKSVGIQSKRGTQASETGSGEGFGFFFGGAEQDLRKMTVCMGVTQVFPAHRVSVR